MWIRTRFGRGGSGFDVPLAVAKRARSYMRLAGALVGGDDARRLVGPVFEAE